MKVFRNVAYNFAYQLLAIILPLVTTPYVSRVLGPQGIGVYNFTGATVSYFVLIGNFGLATYGNREIAYFRDNRKERSSVFWSVWIIRLVFMSSSYLLFLIWLFCINQEKFFWIYIVQSLTIIASVVDVSWFFMGMENFKVTVLRNSMVKMVSFAAILIFVKHIDDVWIYILIITASTLLGNFTMVPLLKKYISFVPIHKLLFKKPIISSLWLFLPTIAVSLYVSLNKTLVGAFDSIKDAGFYSQSDALIKLLLTLSLAVGSAMMPHVSYLFHKGNLEKVYENIYRSFHLMTFFGVAMCFGVIAIADVFVPLFYGPGFEKVASLLMIESLIIILISWSNVIGVQYLIPSDQIKYYTASVTLGSCLNIIINLFAIPLLKVDGAMIATVLAEGSVTCYQLFIVRKQLTIAKLFQGAWKPLISGLCMLASVVILNQLIYSVLHPVYVIIADILIGSSLYFGLNSLFKEASVLFLLKKIQSFL